MRIGSIITLLLVVLPSLVLSARSSPWTFIESSGNGQYYVEMVPDSQTLDGWIMSDAVIFRVLPGPCDEEVWRARVWWGKVHVSNQGRFLVCMYFDGDVGQENRYSIAFYDRGKLLRGYDYEDLVKDESKLMYFTSENQVAWLRRGERPHFTGGRFQLVTCDNIEYLFSLEDGSIYKFTDLD